MSCRLTFYKRKRIGISALCCMMAVVLSSCASERLSGSSAQIAQAEQDGAQAAPLGEVSQAELPPLENNVYAESGALSASDATGAINTEQPANAADLTPAGVAGVWRANFNGMQCQLATPQTKAGQGYRASALHCPSAFAQIGSWNINGKQLLLYDKSGKNLAVLYSTAGNSFVGRARTGASIALRR